MTRFALTFAAALLIARPLCGQKPIVPAARCDKIDTTASWYRTQAAWWALDAKHDWTNDSLRTQLLAVSSLFDAGRSSAMPIQIGAMLDNGEIPGTRVNDQLRAVLPAAQQLLRDMAAKRQWPLRSTVGPAGVRAAWLISSGDSALTNAAMHRMMEAGPGEVSPADVSILEDWLRLRTGRKQIYGSQVHATKGPSGTSYQPDPTEDLAHLDLRRDVAGLPPMAFALCYLKGGS